MIIGALSSCEQFINSNHFSQLTSYINHRKVLIYSTCCFVSRRFDCGTSLHQVQINDEMIYTRAFNFRSSHHLFVPDEDWCHSRNVMKQNNKLSI